MLQKNAGPSTSEEFKVFGHGNPYGIQYKDKILDADQVAYLIKNSPRYIGGEQKVKLYSCETGKLPNGFAQQLADNLGVLVEAPNRELHPTKTGGFEVAKKVTEKLYLRGSWVPFNPKKTPK